MNNQCLYVQKLLLATPATYFDAANWLTKTS